MIGMNSIGKILVVFGGVLIVVGALFMLGGKLPWLGRLPGDICIQRRGVTFFVPITTSLLVSAVLSVILYLIGRR